MNDSDSDSDNCSCGNCGECAPLIVGILGAITLAAIGGAITLTVGAYDCAKDRNARENCNGYIAGTAILWTFALLIVLCCKCINLHQAKQEEQQKEEQQRNELNQQRYGQNIELVPNGNQPNLQRQQPRLEDLKELTQNKPTIPLAQNTTQSRAPVQDLTEQRRQIPQSRELQQITQNNNNIKIFNVTNTINNINNNNIVFIGNGNGIITNNYAQQEFDPNQDEKIIVQLDSDEGEPQKQETTEEKLKRSKEVRDPLRQIWSLTHK